MRVILDKIDLLVTTGDRGWLSMLKQNLSLWKRQEIPNIANDVEFSKKTSGSTASISDGSHFISSASLEDDFRMRKPLILSKLIISYCFFLAFLLVERWKLSWRDNRWPCVSGMCLQEESCRGAIRSIENSDLHRELVFGRTSSWCQRRERTCKCVIDILHQQDWEAD